MVAPAAPDIKAHSAFSRVIVRFRPVPNATDYDIYVDDGTIDGIDTQLTAADETADGWMHAYTYPQVGFIEVYVKAINAGLEASAESNRVGCLIRGGGQDDSNVPTAVKAIISHH